MKKMFLDFEKQLKENISTHKKLLDNSNDVINIIKNINNKLNKGGKILFCGNGGSAADAQHLAAEFIVRLRPNINRNPLPALTLAQDSSTLTACGNDFSFEDIFLRSFKAFASNNDVLVCISTSGNSKNIIKVLHEAKKRKIYSIGFLGKGGGEAKKICDNSIVILSENTARIQECHIFLGHYILEKLEDKIIQKKKS
jgi:D-sedoheptulose 7-phosphate isomerase